VNYEIETIDYIFDVYDYAIFTMAKDPMDTPMETWEIELIPFPIASEKFANWLDSAWNVTESIFNDETKSRTPYYDWTIEIDFYRGIKQKSKLVSIEGYYLNNGRGIYFTSQSLFLYEFLSKFTHFFRINLSVYISVGTDLHIVEFNKTMDRMEFLKEIHSHKTKFERD
jgi:hypothetical protein